MLVFSRGKFTEVTDRQTTIAGIFDYNTIVEGNKDMVSYIFLL